MDRRQEKSREAIFKAFSGLLERKRYEHITVQEIIKEANIGRSTFYAHFETKDMLLKEMCRDIFDHIFTGNICGHKSCSERNKCDRRSFCDSAIECGGGALCKYETENTDLESKLAHILWHLNEIKSDIIVIMSSESSTLFLKYLEEYMLRLFKMYSTDFHANVPESYLFSHLVSSFSSTIKWWVSEKMKTPPKQAAKYFMEVTETH